MQAQRHTGFGRKPSQLPQSRESYSRPMPSQPARYQPATPQPSNIAGYDDIVGTGFSKTGESYNSGKPVKAMRFVSGLIDGVIFAVVLVTYLIMTDPNPTEYGADHSDRILSAFIWLSALWLMISAVMESSSLQGTLGKILTGTKITDEHGDRISFGRSLGRNVAKILSSLIPFYLSYTMVIWSKKSQSLHDLIAGTFVYRKSDGPMTGNVFD